MVRIPDLDLDLLKGDVQFIDEEQARGSKDLALMRRLNAVQVRWVRAGRRRVPSAIPEPPPRIRPNVPRAVPLVPPPVFLQEATPPPPGVDLELLADKLAARLGPTLASLVAQSGQVSTTTVVRNGASGIVQPDETPMFIPGRIVDPDAVAEIQAETSKSEGKGVADAAAALRKARRGRKKKKE
jgi:hypothetical protein